VQGQATVTPCDQGPEELAVCARLLPLSGGGRVALQVQLGLLQPRGGNQGRRVTPHPVARRPILAAGFPGAARYPGGLAVPGQSGLPLGIARLPGIEPMRQASADGSRLPHGMVAGRGGERRRMQTLGELPAGERRLDPGAVPLAYPRGCHRCQQPGRRAARPLGELTIALTTLGPGDARAAAGLFHSPPPRAFETLGALLCSAHPWQWGQQLAWRRLAAGGLQQE
jgi:hypothetical protein